MEQSTVKNTVIGVLAGIQASQQLPCPPLDGGTRPVGTLQDFDSKMWPVARSKIGRKLGIKIPKEINIFGDAKDHPYTIDETVALVCAISDELETQEKSAKSATQ